MRAPSNMCGGDARVRLHAGAEQHHHVWWGRARRPEKLPFHGALRPPLLELPGLEGTLESGLDGLLVAEHSLGQIRLTKELLEHRRFQALHMARGASAMRSEGPTSCSFDLWLLPTPSPMLNPEATPSAAGTGVVLAACRKARIFSSFSRMMASLARRRFLACVPMTPLCSSATSVAPACCSSGSGSEAATARRTPVRQTRSRGRNGVLVRVHIALREEKLPACATRPSAATKRSTKGESSWQGQCGNVSAPGEPGPLAFNACAHAERCRNYESSPQRSIFCGCAAANLPAAARLE